MDDGAVRASEAATGPSRRGHVPALDGLRAIAIGGVLLFHHGIGWAGGGYLGVDLFFVLSGFLITGKLLDEHASHGTIRLREFWAGRARRLLPAMLLLLAGVALYTAVAAEPVAQRGIRGDVLSSLVYVTNWRFIVSDVGYFASTAAPSPVRHLWSLAVEEQFYLLFPLLLLGLTAVLRTRRSLALAIGALVFASVAWTAVLDAGGASTTRLYEGTDTRLATILVGALAAFSVSGRVARPDSALEPASTRWLRPAAAAATAVLVALAAAARGDQSWMYPGGTLAFAVAAAVLVAAAATLPRTGWVRLLGARPMVLVGAISYGIYLWHWPVYLYLTPDRMGFDGSLLLALRVAASVGVATVSYVLVEQPVRNQRIRIPVPGLVTATAMALVAALVFAATVDAPSGDQMAERTRPAPVLAAPSIPDDLAPLENVDPGLVPPAAPRDRPLRLALVGDSVAASLHFYQPRIPELQLSASTTIGCGIMSPAIPVETGELNPDCPGWKEKWAKALDDDPDVVAVVIGAWEIKEHRLEGGRSLVPSAEAGTSAADPATDPTEYVDGRIDEAVELVRQHTDARIAFVELPCAVPQDLGIGQAPKPQSQIELVDWFNSRLAAAAERHPGLVQVVSINQHVCPDDEPVAEVDGIELRYDGIHWSEDGGPIAWAWLLPELFEAAYRPGR